MGGGGKTEQSNRRPRVVRKEVCMWGTSMIGMTHTAQTRRANLRPELTLCPCFIRKPESHPPAIEPKLAAV